MSQWEHLHWVVLYLADSSGTVLFPFPRALGVVTDGTGCCWAAVAEEDSLKTPHFSVSLLSYVMPSCESDARAKSVEADDPFKDRELPGRRHGPAPAGTFSSLGFIPSLYRGRSLLYICFSNWQHRARHAGKARHRSTDLETVESTSRVSLVPLRTLFSSLALSSLS